MMNYLVGYIASLLTFLILDMGWMLGIARKFYRREIGSLLRDEVKLVPVFLFYLMYIAILLTLVVVPYLGAGNGLKRVIISSMLFGFAAYGTYDATNYAILKNWPLSVTIVDVLWGVIVTACAGIAGYSVIQSMG